MSASDMGSAKMKTEEAKALLVKLGCYDFILERIKKFDKL